MEDLYQYPGLTLSQSNGNITINLNDILIRNLESVYQEKRCSTLTPEMSEQFSSVVSPPFTANINFAVVDSNGITLKVISLPYINGKWDYTTNYTHDKAEKLVIIANVQVVYGTCGQWQRYYAAQYITANPFSNIDNSNPNTNIPRVVSLVLKTYPYLGISFGPWRFKRSTVDTGGYFVGGAETFYHTITELPANFLDIKNNKSEFDWPDDISYKIIIDYKKSNNVWDNVYNEPTISEQKYEDFKNAEVLIENAVYDLKDDDSVFFTGDRIENYYTNNKGEFAALKSFDINQPRGIFKEIGTYRVYINKYKNSSIIGTSNVFLIDVSDIYEEVPVDPEEPEIPVDPPVIEEDEYPIPPTYQFNESAYFKHTNGEAFAYNGQPYVGFFHILNGKAYMGKTHQESDVELDRQETLIADVFLRSYHFDTCFGNFQSISQNNDLNSFELLNLNELNIIIDNINDNNIKCYNNLIIQNPTVYNFIPNNNYYYGLSSFEYETRYIWNNVSEKWKNFDYTFGNASKLESIELGLPAKKGYYYIQPFSKNKNWSFLENIKMGSFLLDEYDNFKYFCSDGDNTYILEGSFQSNEPLKLLSKESHTDKIYGIYNDLENSRLFIIRSNIIEIYDSTSFINCNSFVMMDKLETNTSNLNLIKFGKNIRSSVINSSLILYNKYSNEKYYDIDLSTFGIKNIIDLDIRDVDDHVIILYKLNTGFYLCYLDPNNIENSFYNKKIEEINNIDSKIEFSKIDSNIFYIKNQKEYQSRSITFPTYPNGRLENENLLYHDFSYKWGSTKQLYNYIDILWNSSNLESNKYNNYLSMEQIKNNNMYLLLHNNGRIYTIKQPVNDRYLNAVPLNLKKEFIETFCSQSSFGLYFNILITNIIKDILNIYNKCSNTFRFDKSRTYLNDLQKLDISVKDLYINGNETINVIVLRRILQGILEIQKKLLPID